MSVFGNLKSLIDDYNNYYNIVDIAGETLRKKHPIATTIAGVVCGITYGLLVYKLLDIDNCCEQKEIQGKKDSSNNNFNYYKNSKAINEEYLKKIHALKRKSCEDEYKAYLGKLRTQQQRKLNILKEIPSKEIER